MNNQFSENLKKIRKEHNLSQEQLADELGVSRQAISKWESAAAYPEMDKIIALCNKFNLNIDDLLHNDIKEVKGEEESKKKLNNSIDDFLKFITNTINLFSNMNFRSKIKCLIEQCIIGVVLFIVSSIAYMALDALFYNLLNFLPNNIHLFITNILQSILIIALIVVSIIIITHIFKTRYLDYYEKIKKEADIEKSEEDDKNIQSHKDEIDKKNKILLKQNEKKIIIRDPKHSEYRFINALFRIIVLIIKFFALCFGLFVAFVLTCLFCSFITSFLICNTGFFFAGLLATTLSSSVITIIVLLLIINFVFNRKNDKKKMTWSFIISLITFGIGCGLIFIGTLSFDILENNDSMLTKVSHEYVMRDDLIIYPSSDYKINYVESDNNNIRIEYSINEYCTIDTQDDNKNTNMIIANAYCDNPLKLIRGFIKNINEKKFIPIDDSIEAMTVYTTKSNIEILKNNWNNHLSTIKSIDERLMDLERERDELRQKVGNLQHELYIRES